MQQPVRGVSVHDLRRGVPRVEPVERVAADAGSDGTGVTGRTARTGRSRRRPGPAGPPEPEVEPPRMQRVEQPELLDGGQRRPVPDLHRAGPSRIVVVAAAVSASTTAGDVPATPGFRWCSANQYRE